MNLGDVVLLFGGAGSEHRVSVASAQNLASELPEAALWFWTRDGTVVEPARPSLLAHERPFETDFAADAAPRWPSLAAALEQPARPNVVVFLALHGGEGENGTVQDALEKAGTAYTGSGPAASRLAFDKTRARDAVASRGVRVAAAVELDAAKPPRSQLASLLADHGRLVLKPVADGSSHGVRFAASSRELDAVLTSLAETPRERYLAEAFVSGRELTVGVIDAADGGELTPLPCSEVRLDAGRAFDYEGKYLGKGALELTPAPVDAQIADAAQALARRAHETTGCFGYSRTDVIVDEQGPVFLEINTLPGLTAASFIPQQLEAAGISMRAFIERQVELARRRAVTP